MIIKCPRPGAKNVWFAAIRKKPKKNLIHFHLFFKYKIFFFFLVGKIFFKIFLKIFLIFFLKIFLIFFWFFFWKFFLIFFLKIFFVFLCWLDKSGPKFSFGSCLGVPEWLPIGSVPPLGRKKSFLEFLKISKNKISENKNSKKVWKVKNLGRLIAISRRGRVRLGGGGLFWRESGRLDFKNSWILWLKISENLVLDF